MTNPMLDRTAWDDATPDPSLLVADGHQVSVNVRDNCLVIKDGPDGDRVRPIPAVPAIVKHVVITGSHGYVTVEAERWMTNHGITWAHIESVGSYPRTVSTSGPTASSPKLRRRQAMCGEGFPFFDAGLAITRRLLAQKIDGQAHNVETLFGDFEAAKEIKAWGERLPLADDIKTMHGFEGNAAKAYWQAWDNMPIRWKGIRPAKPHWQKFDARASKRHEFDINRNATDPINAALNYAYHLAETTCVIACHGAGLDPEFGISHSDDDGRYSFALDLVEVLRPWCDAKIIELFREPVVKTNFEEVRLGKKDGVCRIKAPLTHRIVSDVHAVSNVLQPAIKDIVKILSM